MNNIFTHGYLSRTTAWLFVNIVCCISAFANEPLDTLIRRCGNMPTLSCETRIARHYLIREHFNLAFPWIKTAAEHGDPESQFQLARFYLNHKHRQATQTAVKHLKRAADRRHGDALLLLARLIRNGSAKAVVEKNNQLDYLNKAEYLSRFAAGVPESRLSGSLLKYQGQFKQAYNNNTGKVYYEQRRLNQALLGDYMAGYQNKYPVAKTVAFRCRQHPQIVSNHTSACPIDGADLLPDHPYFDIHLIETDRTPEMILAIRSGETGKALRYIKKKRQLEAQDRNANTPLFAAAQTGNTRVIRALLDAGANGKRVNRDKLSPLDIALKHGHEQAARALFPVSYVTETSLYYALDSGLNAIADQIVDRIVNTGANDILLSAYRSALMLNRMDAITRLPEPELNPSEWLPHIRHTQTLEFVLKRGVKLHSQTPHIQKLLQNAIAEPSLMLEIYRHNPDKQLLLSAAPPILESDNPRLILPYFSRLSRKEKLAVLRRQRVQAFKKNLLEYVVRDPELNSWQKQNLDALMAGAVRHGSIEVVNILEKTHNTHLRQHVEDPLFLASLHGHLNFVSYLIESGVTESTIHRLHLAGLPGTMDGKTATALEAALSRGHLEVASYLLKHPLQVEGDLLYFSIASRSIDMVERSLQKLMAYPDLHRQLAEAVELALRLDYAEGLKRLVRLEPDMNELTLTPRMFYDINTAEETAIFTGSRHYMHFRSSNGVTPLLLAVFDNDLERAKLLLKHGAAANGSDHAGRTPLMIAAFRGNQQLVNLLLSYKASVHTRDKTGRTALLWAHQNEYEIVHALIKRGANANAKIPFTSSILKFVYSDDIRILKLLLENKADTNLRDQDGKTALMLAKELGKLDYAKLLIAYGAQTPI